MLFWRSALLASLLSGSPLGAVAVELLRDHLREAPGTAETVALARETLEVIAPAVERAGLAAQRAELEDASFRILEPSTWAELSALPPAGDSSPVIARTERLLAEWGIDAVVTGRTKSLYSTHRKMARKGLPLAEITDRVGVRIRVGTVAECDATLDRLHATFEPVVGSFDDYIRSPKPNGYQSLHTAVLVPHGGVASPVEFQVRTHAMHEAAEVGDAAHWRYKLA